MKRKLSNMCRDILFFPKELVVLLNEASQTNLNDGATQVLGAIRKKFWILKEGTAVRRVISKCIKCRTWNAKPEKQIIATLLISRITPRDPPFTSVGIDYFGPIPVKLKRSRLKRYGFIFTCLTMRAIHIEVS